jgi:protein TonB
MLPQQIATANYLDILFENKNKSYGAYPLRKEYARRLYFSLMMAGMIVASFLIAFYLRKEPVIAKFVISGNDTLINILPPVEPSPPVPPPPPPPPPPKQIATSMFTSPPKIVKEADPDDVPPEIETLENTHIAAYTQSGDADQNIEMPPPGSDKGITELPARPVEDTRYIPVQIESSYPGGVNAWKRFLIKTLRYPAKAQQNGVMGAVSVKFIVDVDGKVSDVEAISGPEELRDEAVRVIRMSGKWTPAINNGRNVRTYKQQAIVFQLNDE